MIFTDFGKLVKRYYRAEYWWHYAWIFTSHEGFIHKSTQSFMSLNPRDPSYSSSFKLVIDVGCGPRKFLKAATLKNGWSYLGLDIYPDPDHLHFDGEAIPLRDSIASIVVSTEVLEHAENYSALFSEMVRVLRPGGLLIASVPFMYPVHGAPNDNLRFTTFGLEKLSAEANLSEITTRTFGGLGSTLLFPVIWLRHFGLRSPSKILRVVSHLVLPLALLIVPVLNVTAYLVNQFDSSRLFYTGSVVCALKR